MRIGRNSMEKRHFKFTCQSPNTGKDIYILLDILFAENPYARVVDCEIAWYGGGRSGCLYAEGISEKEQKFDFLSIQI